MRSRAERITWGAAAALALAGAASAFWWSDQWLPQAEPWLANTWLQMTRPGPATRPAPTTAKSGQPPGGKAAALDAPATVLRKCLEADGRITYTDRLCGAGAREQAVDGAVSILPPRSP